MSAADNDVDAQNTTADPTIEATATTLQTAIEAATTDARARKALCDSIAAELVNIANMVRSLA